MPASWAPSAPDTIEDRLGSLGERAKKRTGYQVTPNRFVVLGDSKLSDSYDTYDIVLEGTKYHCSCQTHAGGVFRKMCSHIAYVVMARRGIISWHTEPEPEPVLEFDTDRPLPDAPYPPFVSSEPITEDAYAQMLETFGNYNPEPLPSWVEWIYPHQWDAYCEILFQFDAGKKVIFLSAPTGSGKTLIAELVRRSLSKQALYVCTTKTLQDQVEHDFPYAKVIKGRSNYRTLNFPDTEWLACDLCEQTTPMDDCRYCKEPDLCPYKVARGEAIKSSLAVANTAYFLYESNGKKTRFGNRGNGPARDLIILDEADSLEDELMGYVSIDFSPRTLKTLGIDGPEKKTVTDSWQDWLENTAKPALVKKIFQLQYSTDPKNVRTLKHLERIFEQVSSLTFDESWVYTDYERGWVRFKPVKVDEAAPKVLWRSADRWLLMSATIISAQQMAEDLGLEDDEWTVIEVPSTFPPENRPVYIEPVANITAKTKETEWPRAAERIDQIAAWHNERILVHTVSYQFATYLTEQLGPRAITYRSAKERNAVLASWLETDNGILIAPSFERGIDLPYDDCRVVIVAKVPFPNLGDKQVNKRLYSRGGKGWYAMQTVRSMVQMTGRAMRRADDTCESYIIDAQFVENVWKKNRHLIPEWWKDAMVMSGSPNWDEIRRGKK